MLAVPFTAASEQHLAVGQNDLLVTIYVGVLGGVLGFRRDTDQVRDDLFCLVKVAPAARARSTSIQERDPLNRGGPDNVL